MNIKNIEGKDIKRKLLKEVLFRVDYNLLTTKEIDSIIADIKTNYADNFESYNVETINGFDLRSNDIAINNDEISNKNQEEKYNHVFSKAEQDGDRYTVKISRQFMYLDINPSLNYKGTKKYYNLFSDLIKTISTNNRFFNIKRVGLRKFNNFFIKHDYIKELTNIFDGDMCSLWIPESYELKRKLITDSFQYNEIGLNFVREIRSGKYDNEQEVYLVAFDYDIYSSDSEYLNVFIDDVVNKIEALNDKVFDVFKRTMDDEFIYKVLVNEEKTMEDYGILGED